MLATCTLDAEAFLNGVYSLTLLHSERPRLYTILAFLSAIELKNLPLEE